MFNKITLPLAFCGLAVLGVADVAPALADHRYVAGGLSVGGLHFEIVHHGSADGYTGSYLRVAGAFGHGGPSCSRSCYRDRGQHYHHSSCPALRGHIAHHRPDLLVVLSPDRYHRTSHHGDYAYHGRGRHAGYRDDERYDDEHDDYGAKHNKHHDRRH